MRDWSPQRVAAAAGGRLLGDAAIAGGGPARVVLDSRAVEPGDLFVGLAGANADGGAFARDALDAGAWGVLAATEHVQAAADGRGPASPLARGARSGC